MNAKFTMRMAIGCSVLMAVCQSTTLAFGHGGGGFSGGGNFHSANVSMPHNVNTVRTSTQFQNVQSLNSRNFNLQKHVTTNTGSNAGLKLVTKNPQLNVIKVPVNRGIIQPTGGTTNPTGGNTFPGKGVNLPVNGGVILPPTGGTNPTGGGVKFPGGGVKFPGNGGVILPPTGGTNPTGGGSTPPSGGSMPPSGSNCPSGYCGNNWWSNGLWFNPAIYGAWGYGGGSFGGSGSGYAATPVVYNDASTAVPGAATQPVVNVAQGPAIPADKLTLKLGQSYTIVNDHFGEKAGNLSVAISGVTLPIRVDKWDAEQITFTLPTVELDKPTDGLFNVAGSDHQLTKAVPVVIVAAQ
jgi:hypothetical protein